MEECLKEFEECFELCVEESQTEPGPSCGSYCWKLYWECLKRAPAPSSAGTAAASSGRRRQ